jgi:hypothetical protein
MCLKIGYSACAIRNLASHVAGEDYSVAHATELPSSHAKFDAKLKAHLLRRRSHQSHLTYDPLLLQVHLVAGYDQGDIVAQHLPIPGSPSSLVTV